MKSWIFDARSIYSAFCRINFLSGADADKENNEEARSDKLDHAWYEINGNRSNQWENLRAICYASCRQEIQFRGFKSWPQGKSNDFQDDPYHEIDQNSSSRARQRHDRSARRNRSTLTLKRRKLYTARYLHSLRLQSFCPSAFCRAAGELVLSYLGRGFYSEKNSKWRFALFSDLADNRRSENVRFARLPK